LPLSVAGSFAIVFLPLKDKSSVAYRFQLLIFQHSPFVVHQATDLGIGRYSRRRSSALGRRLGVTVRFTVPGATSLRCDLAMVSRLPRK
jgi:hypothetical protein